MTATIGLVLDCTNPTELARFWSEALGYTPLGGAGNYVMLVDPDSVRPKLLLQAVPEAKTTKNRMHLDIAERLGEPGAALESAVRHAFASGLADAMRVGALIAVLAAGFVAWRGPTATAPPRSGHRVGGAPAHFGDQNGGWAGGVQRDRFDSESRV